MIQKVCRILWGMLMLSSVAAYSQQVSHARQEAAVIPLPVSWERTGGAFEINNRTVIYLAGKTAGATAAELLRAYLSQEQLSSIKVVTTRPTSNYIQLAIDRVTVPQPEGYRLVANQQHVAITGHDAAGVLYGIQSLRQLWQQEAAVLKVEGTIITDYPRFGYRGMALDVSRHFFSVAFVKQYIDLLSFYKYNTFHWHLTDDQGWRIEIKKYPQLQTVAAWRKETLIGHKKELPHRYDGQRYGGYYSQAEVKEVVRYAAQRNITIIPEIEMPGHALAALSAYPSLGCTGGPYQAAPFWGVFDDVFCAGNDSTFSFLQDVLDEVIQLFPGHYLHIGGDECPKTRWKTCAKCQRRMQQAGLPDEHALQSYFIQRIEKYVNSKGRDIIGWDEILEGGLAPNATVMSWRGEEGGIAAAGQHHRFIMTPESYMYFDYYQSLEPAEPVAAGNYTPLQKVYAYEPSLRLTDSLMRYMAGVEGQAWSEYFTSEAQAMYMIFPRAIALAEVAWSPGGRRAYTDFVARLQAQESLLQQWKVNYARSFTQAAYQPPVVLHKAVNADVSLSAQPVDRFNPGAQVLVNGISGNHRYNDGQWLGFQAPVLEIVLDLKKVQAINSIRMNVLNYHWQRIWQPEKLEVLVATDTSHYKKVLTQDAFPVNGINAVSVAMANDQARYVKVIVYNRSVIPVGEYGAGGKPLLMIDEITID